MFRKIKKSYGPSTRSYNSAMEVRNDGLYNYSIKKMKEIEKRIKKQEENKKYEFNNIYEIFGKEE